VPYRSRPSRRGGGHGGDRIREPVEYGVGLFVGERQRREEAYDARVAAAQFDDQTAAEALALDGRGDGRGGRVRAGGTGRPGRLGVDHLDADHQPPPPYVTDTRELLGETVEVGEHPGAQSRGALGETVLADVGEGGGSGGHGELVAAEGARVGAGLPHVEVVAVDHDGEGKAAADGLGEDHDVGDDPAVFDRPEAPRAPHTRLDLVSDQRDGPRGRDLAHPSQPFVRRRDDAALALDGFEDHPGGRRDTGLDVVEDGLGPPGGEFGAAFAADAERAAVVLGIRQAGDPYVTGAPGRFERPGGHSVVGAGEGEHPGAAGRRSHQFEGGLHRVRTGGPAELNAGAVREAGREGAEQFGGEGVLDGGGQIEDVQRGARVEDLADRFEDDGMVVPEGEGAGAGQAVEIAAAVRALDGEPSGPHRHDRQSTRIGTRRRLARRLPPQDPLVRRGRPLVLPPRGRPFVLVSRARPFGLAPHRCHRRLGHRHDYTSSRCSEASWQGSPSTGGSPPVPTTRHALGSG
jgi:hypothetical protein